MGQLIRHDDTARFIDSIEQRVQALERITAGALSGSMRVPIYTMGTLPSAADHMGGLVFVSDAAPGARFQGSDGIDWVELG